MTKELNRGATVIHLELLSIHFLCELQHLAHHHTADSLAAKLLRHGEIVDTYGVGGEGDCHHRHEVPDELPEQAACRDLAARGLLIEECADGRAVRRVDRPHEEPLSTHCYPTRKRYSF